MREDIGVTDAAEAEKAEFTLVVPLYQEAQRFPEYGPKLADWVAVPGSSRALVFVDDGSTDATPSLVEALIDERGEPEGRMRLLQRPHEGKGAAVAAGLEAAASPFAGFCDLDLSTPLTDLEGILQTARRTRVLAIGSRDLAGSRLVRPESALRELLGRSYNRLIQATLTPGIVDTQCGAKVASSEVWQAILPLSTEQGFAWDAEVIALARAVGIAVQEVPVAWSHDERSQVRLTRDGVAMVRATPRIWRAARRARAGRHAEADAEVFDDTNAERLMASDADHWWFRSKAAYVSSSLRKFAAARGWLADVGAGSGGVTSMLGWSTERRLVVEGSETLVRQAQHRHGLAGTRALAGALPLADGSTSVVCLLDVIEHLDDPIGALREARRVLTDDGVVVITVPAHTWLWSEADELLGHVCRYTRGKLHHELRAAGLRPVRTSHIFSWLVAPVLLKRRLGAGGDATLGLDQSSEVLDRVALVLTWLERAVLRVVSLPVGTSILAVATVRTTSGAVPASPTR